MPPSEQSPPGAATDPSRLPIPCPVLGCLIVEGNVAFDPQQRVKVADVARSARQKARMSCPLAFLLTSVGPLANKASDYLNNQLHNRFRPYELRGGLLQHPDDTGILIGQGFNQERWDAFVAHSSDGRTFTIENLVDVVAANTLRDKTSKGVPSAMAEMGAILHVFGYYDDQGVRRLDIATARDLFQRTRFPAGQDKHPKSGLLSFLWLIFRMFRLLPAAKRRLAAAAGAAG